MKMNLFECVKGNRWSSAKQDYIDEICTFSGCGCGKKVKMFGATEDEKFAFNWFRNIQEYETIICTALTCFGPLTLSEIKKKLDFWAEEHSSKTLTLNEILSLINYSSRIKKGFNLDESDPVFVLNFRP